jgi:ABC-type bacteriocin/lantibiotic exporter with double-glycine peptidase domain
MRLEPSSPARGKGRVAIGLLQYGQHTSLILLTLARIAVGLCDLLVAAAMYLLFLLLQGRTPSHHFAWIPTTTLSLSLITACLIAIRTLLDIFSARSVFRQIQGLYIDLLLRLMRGYSEMRWSRFVECNRSELSNNTLYTTREAADFYHRCVELTAAIVIVAVMGIAIIYQSPLAACGLGVAFVAYYGMHRFIIRRKLQTAAFSREESLRVLVRNLADMFSSAREIRAYRNHAFFHRRVQKQAERVAMDTLNVTFLPQIARIVADQGAVLIFLGMIVAVELRQGDARQLLSLLAFYFVLSRRLLPLISQISVIAGQMESSYENVRIVDRELNLIRLHRADTLVAQPPNALFVLEFNRINFFFRRDVPLLRDVSLRLCKGETMLLYGASGSGKSSLLNLIAGVIQPVSGLICVDQSSVAYVPQEILLLDDSIRNNLLFGLPERSDQELMEALSVARLDEFVRAQPLGLETKVGDNGALFSGGQRQRLGLARAILRGSQLLLLDEATSALDEENERQVLENLSALGKAILFVTHRATMRSFASRVVRLQEGCLIEERLEDDPTLHDELLESANTDNRMTAR